MTDDTRDPRDVKVTTVPPRDLPVDEVDDRGPGDGGDVSPHPGGRAQPGDVLGIETGGETTEIGDTVEDENKRRRNATEK
jgi:hypothetical protein